MKHNNKSVFNYGDVSTCSFHATKVFHTGEGGCIIANDDQIANAEKGSVLNARILWTFSASYQTTKNENHKNLAKRAFEYLAANFYDTQFGGLFWSINEDKTPKDTKNQIYALAFAIYGLSEYYSISEDQKALEMAINLYSKIQDS